MRTLILALILVLVLALVLVFVLLLSLNVRLASLHLLSHLLRADNVLRSLGSSRSQQFHVLCIILNTQHDSGDDRLLVNSLLLLRQRHSDIYTHPKLHTSSDRNASHE